VVRIRIGRCHEGGAAMVPVALALSHHAMPCAMLGCTTRPSSEAEQIGVPCFWTPSLQNHELNKLPLFMNSSVYDSQL
jgi:hypothetical protein